MAKKIKMMVVLDEETKKIVNEEAMIYGSNFSETLRRMIYEHRRVNPAETVIIGGETAEKEARNV